jgi:heptosyltransferase-2
MLMGRPVNPNLARRIDAWGGVALAAVLWAIGRLRGTAGGVPLPPMRATTPPGREVAGPRRVLAIKFYGLGNLVMILPVLQALREAFPAAEIDFLTFPENELLLQRSRLVRRVLAVDIGGVGRLLATLGRALRAIRRADYDLVLDFEQFLRLSAILAFLSGARERIGFNTDGQRRGWLFTTRVVYSDREHMSRIFMRLLRPLGIEAAPRPVSIVTEPTEEARVAELLAARAIGRGRFPLVVMHVGSGPNFYRVPLKRWPIEHFARLADALVARHGAAVLLTGKGPEERGLVEATRRLMREPAVEVCDQLSVTELIALIRQSHLVIANDTSVMHLAAAAGTPVVAFFGPTAPFLYGPGNAQDLVFYRDLYCSPCLSNYNLKVSRCLDPVCMRAIAVDEVLAGIEARFLGPQAPLRAVIERRAASAR